MTAKKKKKKSIYEKFLSPDEKDWNNKQKTPFALVRVRGWRSARETESAASLGVPIAVSLQCLSAEGRECLTLKRLRLATSSCLYIPPSSVCFAFGGIGCSSVFSFSFLSLIGRGEMALRVVRDRIFLVIFTR